MANKYRLAKSLVALRDTVNLVAPTRSRASDGWIGDAAHASRKSDHNPWIKDGAMGVVTALDITHDPARGMDGNQFAEAVIKDPRVKYVIWNRRIWSPGKGWRKYTGTNPHDKHVHVSASSSKKLYDDIKPWAIEASPPAAVIDETKPRTILKLGAQGGAVFELQRLLGTVKVDGDFGPKTQAAVKAFQKAQKLVADGIVGPYTWDALLKNAPVEPPSGPSLPPTVTEVRKFWREEFSEIASDALTAGFIWESGGQKTAPWSINFEAVGDAGKSHGSGQWQGPRLKALDAFAADKGQTRYDPWTQMQFAAHELKTTEKKAASKLHAATTLEAANDAAITYWRPSIPHADKRLALSRDLYAQPVA